MFFKYSILYTLCHVCLFVICMQYHMFQMESEKGALYYFILD